VIASFSYLRARSLEEAARESAAPAAWVLAGGSDLLTCLRENAIRGERVVSLRDLDALRRIRRLRGGLGIGALVTIAKLAADRDVQRLYPVLAEAATAVASPQIRNQGTLGGNLCQKPRCWYWRGEFPCVRKGGAFCSAVTGQNQFHAILGQDACVYVHPSDTAPALVALGASIGVTGPRGERTVRAERFFVSPAEDPTRETVLAPGEIVTEIVVPPPPPNARSRYRKVRARRAWDFALASVALQLAFEEDRVAAASVVLGGVAPIPWRAKAAEETLRGQRLTPETAARAAAAAVAGAEPLEHNGAKVEIARGLVEAELLALA
jgi:xanthine dehydrogenase YagS FAD-binding subunit